MTNRSISDFPLYPECQLRGAARCSPSALSSAGPLFSALGVYPDQVGVSGVCPARIGTVNLRSAAFARSPLATRDSLARRSFSGGGPLSPTIPAPRATAALRVVPPPTVTTTSSIHCRRADIFELHCTNSLFLPSSLMLETENSQLRTPPAIWGTIGDS